VKPAFQAPTVKFVEDLEVPDWLKVQLLGETRSELTVPLLLQFLDSRDINIVRTTAAFLGETNDRDAIALLTNRLEDIDSQLSAQKTFRDSDPTSKIWTAHVEALACVSPQDAIRFLRNKLSVSGGFDTTLTMFTGAPDLLMKLDSKAMLTELINKLQDTQDNYQKSHILTLSEQVRLDDSIIPQLAQILAAEEDELIRARIIKIIGKTNSELAITTLIELIDQPSPRIRQQAAFSLSKFDRREAIPELMLALRAGYLDARTNGIRSLARLREEEPLWNIVQEKVTGWQTAVVELIKLGRAEALPDL
jgi:HEAT repeat protein